MKVFLQTCSGISKRVLQKTKTAVYIEYISGEATLPFSLLTAFLVVVNSYRKEFAPLFSFKGKGKRKQRFPLRNNWQPTSLTDTM